jgi:hypothetical protein
VSEPLAESSDASHCFVPQNYGGGNGQAAGLQVHVSAADSCIFNVDHSRVLTWFRDVETFHFKGLFES